MSRRDDAEILYNKSNKLNEWCQILFWTNCNFSVISLLFDGILTSIGILMQIVTSFLYIILKSVDDGHYWYMAESVRRKNNIQVGLDVDLTEFETNEFYNNSLEPSIFKYGMNTFESVFFSKEIAAKMLVKSFIKAVLAVILLILVGWFNLSQGVILVITQAVFSTYIIEETIMLVLYKSKLDKLYALIYAEFITVGISKKNQQSLLLSYVVEYEAIKAHYKVRISSSLFKRYNSEMSNRWKEIEGKCRVKERITR